MSSPSIPFQTLSNHSEPSDILQDFQHLPFSFDNHFLSFLPTSSQHVGIFDASVGILQLPISEDLNYFQQINTSLNQPFSFEQSFSSFSSHSQIHSQHLSRSQSPALSSSSIPDLVPNEDIRDNGVPDLYTVYNTFDLNSLNGHLDTSLNTFEIRPPSYTASDTNPPGYHPPWEREVILRRIRILQNEATDLYRIVDQRREENIAIYNAAVNSQLRDHDTRYQQNIEHLEDLLDIWN